MAFDSLPKLTTHLSLLFLLVLSMTSLLAQATHVKECKYEKELSYNVIVLYDGATATEVPIAGIAGQPGSPGTYGTLYAVDIPMFEGPSSYSREVGRIRGMVLGASKDGSIHYSSATVMFTNSSEYDGNTLQVQGIDEWASKEPSYFSIVGGTKMWEGAQGISIYQPYDRKITLKFSVPCSP